MNRYRKALCLLLAVMLTVVPAGIQGQEHKTEARIYNTGDIFVAPNGTSAAAGTEAAPKDLITAINTISAGHTIWMLSGTYSFDSSVNITETNCGTATNMKKLSSIDGGRVVLDFSSMEESSSNRGFVMAGKYWHIYGIEITGAGDNGMILSGISNRIEMCVFYENRDTGLQVSRTGDVWPANNYIVNCTSYNNMDADGEDADGFAAKLTCGEGNIFDGCLSYNNSDDGWDLYAKTSTGPIGVVTIKNCIAFRNGKLTNGMGSSGGDMNGFKLGGAGVGTPHIVENCIAFENGANGFTDNNNPTAITLLGCTSFNNSLHTSGNKSNFGMSREAGGRNCNLLSVTTRTVGSDAFIGTIENSIYYNKEPAYYHVADQTVINGKEKLGTTVSVSASDFVSLLAPDRNTDFHTVWRNTDGSLNTHGFLEIKNTSALFTLASDGGAIGARFSSVKETAAPTAGPTASPTTGPTASPTTGPTVAPTAAPTDFLLGDVNNSGKIDVKDVLLVLQHSVAYSLLNEAGLKAADTTQDNTVDTADALLILKYIVGRIDGFSKNPV